jgi:threonine/homoserine/homoserine lactone efflux protein
MLLAINHGSSYGIKRTCVSGLGNLAGNLAMALVSVAGLGALLLTSGAVFNCIKWIGIAYLIYIGVKLFFEHAPEPHNPTDIKPLLRTKKLRSLFLDGFVIAIGNPKGILFFTALFPQFISRETATITVFGVIFGTLGIIAFGCYMLYALVGARINRIFSLRAFRKAYNRVTGSLFIGTGIALACTKK